VRDVTSKVLADPSIVAAIGAPGLEAQAAIGDALDAAGVPWISLSGVGSRLDGRGWDGWRRMIADQETQGRVLGDAIAAVAQGGACLLGDGTTASRGLLRGVEGAFDGETVLRATVPEGQAGVGEVARAVERSGCGAVVWGGEGIAAAAVRRQLVDEGLRRVRFAGGDRMRDEVYIEAAGPAAEGTLATCPCVDVTTSTELVAQRFIQDYQAEFGLPPGPYAVEAWDAARLLVAAFRGGATTRQELLAAVAATDSYEGLGGAYRFDRTGELAAGAERVTVSEVAGGRWLAAPAGR
jgi:branched-chain amino acid transport system substrate-binding protein